MSIDRNLSAYASNALTHKTGLSHSENVIMLLLKKYPEQSIPESSVISYYQKYVQRYKQKESYGIIKDYREVEIRNQALQWFYRSLGKLVSRQLVVPYQIVKI